MTSATTRGTRGRVAEGYGLVLFAAVMLFWAVVFWFLTTQIWAPSRR